MCGLTDAIRETEGARSFDAAADVLDLGAAPRLARFLVEVGKVASGENLEACDHLLADEILDGCDGSTFRDLHLEFAFAEFERQDLGNEAIDVGFRDHVLSGDTKVHVALSDETRDVGRGQEDAVRQAVSGRDVTRGAIEGQVRLSTYRAMLWLRTRHTSRR